MSRDVARRVVGGMVLPTRSGPIQGIVVHKTIQPERGAVTAPPMTACVGSPPHSGCEVRDC